VIGAVPMHEMVERAERVAEAQAQARTGARAWWFSAWGTRYDSGWCFGASPEAARERVVSELAARGFRGTYAICLTTREGNESVRFERVEIGK